MVTINNGTTTITPSVVLNLNTDDNSNIGIHGWINQSVSLDYSVWSKTTKGLNYTLKLTNAEKWFIDQIMINRLVTIINDSTNGVTSWNCWLINASIKMSNEFSKPWEYSVNFIKIT